MLQRPQHVSSTLVGSNLNQIVNFSPASYIYHHSKLPFCDVHNTFIAKNRLKDCICWVNSTDGATTFKESHSKDNEHRLGANEGRFILFIQPIFSKVVLFF